MSGPELGFPKKEDIETQKTFRVEHLPWADVVLNLDSSHKEDLETVLGVIKKNGPPKGPLSFLEVSFDSNYDNKKFFMKRKSKSTSQRIIDFALNRSKNDPINQDVAYDFNKEARYALVSILSEITLSPKIKRLVALNAFQKLAKDHGFTKMEFSEPIAAVVEQYFKYLIYRYIKDPQSIHYFLKKPSIDRFVSELRKLFMDNGIIPHDLRSQQLLVTEQNGERVLHLIDIEAYTIKSKPTGSPKTGRFFRW